VRSSRRRIADTGVLVAFANADDAPTAGRRKSGQRHGAAPHLRGSPRGNGVSPRSASVAFAMLSEGLVALALTAENPLFSSRALPTRYADRKPDLADLCRVRMSKLSRSLP